MEYVDSSWNSGDTTSVVTSLIKYKNTDRIPVKDDNFRCTFFRQPKPKSLQRNDTLQLSDKNSISHNLSDTDSESELDEPVNALPCIQTLSTTSSSQCMNNDQISKPNEKPLDASRVTFDRTIHVRSSRTTKSCLSKRSTRRENGHGVTVTQVARPTKNRNCLKQKNDPKQKSKKYCVRFCTSRFPKKYENRVALKDKTAREEYARNNRNVHSEKRVLFRGIKRSHDFTNVVQNYEGTCKKKKLVANKIVKNKRLLKSVKEVIREINEQDDTLRLALASVQSIKPQNKIAEIDLTKMGESKVQVQKSKNIINNHGSETKIQRPFFKKPEVEKLLDESMRKATQKYRTCRDTWDSIKKEQFMEA